MPPRNLPDVPTRTWRQPFLAGLLLAGIAATLHGASVTVGVDRPGARINPAMWGIFFEDINFGADGGLYAELVKNRSFDFPEPLMGWSVPAASAGATRVTVTSENPAAAVARRILKVESSGDGAVLENEGFRGIGVRAGEGYDFTTTIRGVSGMPLTVEIVAPSGDVIASSRLQGWGADWTRAAVTLVAKRTELRARLRLAFGGPGTAEMQFVSLFPVKTWKGRPGGLRADMVQALADLGPGFLRFPGGCIVEGSVLDLRYQWKKTIGPVADRPLLFNRWNAEIKKRPTSDYFQSFGLGFYEYFVLCEDLGAEPLPVVNCGMACQFNSGQLAPMDQLEPYIQDALDLVEFANGPATTAWGSKRAAMGHPEPFHMRMLGVGNEQWGPQYMERYARFSRAFREKHPEIALVGAAGPSPEDPRFIYAWKQMRTMKADYIDEHCYAKPEWFLNNAHRYDAYDRNDPKVFMGEYAAQSVDVVSPDNKNTWGCALAEAAYMTGMERNADVVRMASYAPLFAHVDAWQWTPDLVWVDNLRTLLTPSYHVQRLFARNRGDVVLPVAFEANSPDEARRVYVSSVYDESSGAVIVKLVNAMPRDAPCTVKLDGVKYLTKGAMTVLRADDLEAVNSFDNPDRVAPRETDFSPTDTKFEVSLPANSLTLLRVGTAR
jgi:alpha-N-arabinofuranosidase